MQIRISKIQQKINHFMYIDDVKHFAQNKNKLETLIQTEYQVFEHSERKKSKNICAFWKQKWRKQSERRNYWKGNTVAQELNEKK